jgi:hypothetical protein
VNAGGQRSPPGRAPLGSRLDYTPDTGNALQQKVTCAIVARHTPDLVQAFESTWQLGPAPAHDRTAQSLRQGNTRTSPRV